MTASTTSHIAIDARHCPEPALSRASFAKGIHPAFKPRGVGGFGAHVAADIPEQVSLSFYTTDFKGGDAGHGGKGTLAFEIAGGAFAVQVGDEQIDLGHEAGTGAPVAKVVFSAMGDQELGGFAEALVELGLKLGPLVQWRRAAQRREAEAEFRRWLDAADAA
jgi:hypothetical protein